MCNPTSIIGLAKTEAALPVSHASSALDHAMHRNGLHTGPRTSPKQHGSMYVAFRSSAVQERGPKIDQAHEEVDIA
jgi:hypothetical protein